MLFRLVEDYILESKEDIQRFVDKFGQDIYDRLQKNKQRILRDKKDPKLVDISWLVKNKTQEEVEEILKGAEDVELDTEGRRIPKPTNTKELVYSKDRVKVYKIYDVEDMIDIGRDTGWCISGRYVDDEEDRLEDGEVKVSQAKKFFGEYKDKLNLDCYYVFVKGNEKYCVLLSRDGKLHSIWNKDDYEIDSQGFLDVVGEAAEIVGLKDWSKKVFVWDGKSKVPNNVVSVEIEDGVTSIGGWVFSHRYKLSSVIIPDSVTSIGDRAFLWCSRMVSITIPDSIMSIKEQAFSHCSSLRSVIIGTGVTNIRKGAFFDCDNLTDIYYSGTEEQWNRINIREYNEDLLKANIHFNLQ